MARDSASNQAAAALKGQESPAPERAPFDSRRIYGELFGLVCFFWTLFLLLSLITYDPADPSFNVVTPNRGVKNGAGLVGAYIGGILVDFFGVGAYAFVLVFAVVGLKKFIKPLSIPWWRWVGFLLLCACAMVILSAPWAMENLSLGAVAGGGFLGRGVFELGRYYLRPSGAFLVWLFAFLTAVQLVGGLTWTAVVKRCKGYALDLWLKHKERILRKHKVKQRRKTPSEGIDPQDAAKSTPNAKPEPRFFTAPFAEEEEAPFELKLIHLPEQEEAEPTAEEKPARAFSLFGKSKPEPAELDQDAHVFDSMPVAPPEPTQSFELADEAADTANEHEESGRSLKNYPIDAPSSPTSSHAPLKDATPEHAPKDPASARVLPRKPSLKKVANLFRKPKLPSTDLLAPVLITDNKPSQELLLAKAETLKACLADFGVHGEVQRVSPGPVVTMFEYKPAPGVKISRIANLSDDLALALKAMAIRIEAPIPGKDSVGIEVPSETRETVHFREMLESSAFKQAKSLLTMTLGKDISGRPQVADLARMPHLLVAGATGAGKSVCLNSILLSFLFKAKPEEVKLLLIDPKRIELSVYDNLPHLVHPVVTDMTQAKNALDWAVHEMDQRYEAMARLGARNIEGYNHKLSERQAKVDHEIPEDIVGLEPMPFLVIIIDELADLMLTAAKEVEMSIVRLAQLARAAGIHMILATQRPSVDVVTGLIKANFPCRISFQVTSKHDARTILDQVGSEHLLGKGDMLFKPGGGKLQRMHAPYVSDEDVNSVVDFWKSMQKPNYALDFAEWGSNSDAEAAGGGSPGSLDGDSIYREAVTFVSSQGKASISLLQRRFRIGFNRSARYIEQMEADGIIGPADGSKPRIVLKGSAMDME